MINRKWESILAHGWNEIFNLLILLFAALCFGTIAERFKQSAIVGYLVAGMIVGPNALRWVATLSEAQMITELGVALLLFSIGLEFSFRKVARLGIKTGVVGVLQIGATWAAATAVSLIAGIDSRSAIVIGAAISLSSTASVFRLLADKTMMESAHGRPAVGVLLIQDAAVVPLVLLVTALSGSATFSTIIYDLAKVAVISAAAFAVLFVLLNHIVPRALAMKVWTKNRELPMLLSVVVAIGASIGAHEIGVSPAFGAFLAGMLLAESPFSTQIRADIGSLRAVMVTLFFAAVGMFADPVWIAENIVLVLAVSILILVAKTAIVSIIMIAMRFRPGVSVAAGLCLSQVGEFSFALASIALASAVLSQNEFKLIVSATIMTLLATPYLVNSSSLIEAKISSLSARKNSNLERAQERSAEISQKQGCILIIGFGPAGKKLVERLKECYSGAIRVLDVNPQNAQAARSYGVEFQIGDASNTEVLEHAGVRSSIAVAITLPDPEASIRIIHLTRSLNPGAIIAARARYDIFARDIENAGAVAVVNEEEQVGVHLAEEVQSLLKTKGVCAIQPHQY